MFVLFGVVSAAGLAIVIDRLLAWRRDGLALHSDARIFAALTGLAIVIAAASIRCSAARASAASSSAPRTFDEQYILGHVIADRLQAGGIAATRREGLGSTVVFRALAAGDLDVYVDYSGTIWASEMKRSDAPGRAAVLGQMAEWMRKTYGIRLLGGPRLRERLCLRHAARQGRRTAHQILADLATYAPRLEDRRRFRDLLATRMARRWSRPMACTSRCSGKYQSNLMYSALVAGDVGRDQRLLQRRPHRAIRPEGAGAIPRARCRPYDAILLVSPAHANDARLIAALQPLVGAIDLATMQKANLMVDRPDDKKSPAEAAQWLEKQIGR